MVVSCLVPGPGLILKRSGNVGSVCETWIQGFVCLQHELQIAGEL
jgi:hypothetical protein